MQVHISSDMVIVMLLYLELQAAVPAVLQLLPLPWRRHGWPALRLHTVLLHRPLSARIYP